MRLPRWKPLTVHHLLAMFDAHRSSASGNITYLICHMTSQDHVIERSCEVTDGSTPLYVTIQLKLDGNRHCGSGDMFFVFQVISEDHVTLRTKLPQSQSPT